MKKYLFTLMMALMVSVSSFAQTQYYQTFGFASKQKTSYGWTGWTDWQDSNMTITLDLTRDVITIYSPTTQRFRVLDNGTKYTDNSGGSNIKFYCLDTVDNLRCNVRFRIESNGNSQIYVEYNDLMYVYNVRRTR